MSLGPIPTTPADWTAALLAQHRAIREQQKGDEK